MFNLLFAILQDEGRIFYISLARLWGNVLKVRGQEKNNGVVAATLFFLLNSFFDIGFQMV